MRRGNERKANLLQFRVAAKRRLSGLPADMEFGKGGHLRLGFKEGTDRILLKHAGKQQCPLFTALYRFTLVLP